MKKTAGRVCGNVWLKDGSEGLQDGWKSVWTRLEINTPDGQLRLSGLETKGGKKNCIPPAALAFNKENCAR